MSGIFVAIVGPSGVGKDSLLSYARESIGEDMVVVRRTITRAAEESSEEHDSLTVAQFAMAVADGEFSLHWQAHGLSYALPKNVERELASGRLVVANLSRAVLPMAAERFDRMVVVAVTARPEVIVQRLFGRGRESAEEIRDRLNRLVDCLPAEAIEIDNSDAIDIAGDKFVSLLKSLLAKPH
ncbi:MAG: phosphonate metabolism protein/1,5-bisphosphokinase (PRPP-forming) PhnN [Devosia sp.]|jgi:ribose 1,5-bisphosphokinase|uniref:phosphonate metabolism protein/1,5-bisphosphokinase (PRPP-forming) PhnN n=1 Tax=unclassified Devosia TaxID=196773 RepID=UPI0019FD7DCE|nr:MULTISPECIES: phosphonate metabolism protein/1,5-bisphosphokinase (PRPP-forming) PhnN [unclassified Devosia]MBF0678680.1 phosphonate metabolism protein/1,5-bisphosphokinase (PRPP-forming) PhnN [Devosia sp.]WEJ31749.1 phosphonate metabolism protein/1,5-bisphosphokinase (PRPP-forming) PhnN [Devosia sp. SD17-2]